MRLDKIPTIREENIIGVDFIGRYERLSKTWIYYERDLESIKSIYLDSEVEKKSRNNDQCKAYEELINDIYEDDLDC